MLCYVASRIDQYILFWPQFTYYTIALLFFLLERANYKSVLLYITIFGKWSYTRKNIKTNPLFLINRTSFWFQCCQFNNTINFNPWARQRKRKAWDNVDVERNLRTLTWRFYTFFFLYSRKSSQEPPCLNSGGHNFNLLEALRIIRYAILLCMYFFVLYNVSLFFTPYLKMKQFHCYAGSFVHKAAESPKWQVTAIRQCTVLNWATDGSRFGPERTSFFFISSSEVIVEA